MLNVTLYSRAGCHLCDQAKADLEALSEQYPHKLIVVDVDGDKEFRKAYGEEVPVVEVGPYRLKAPFSLQELQMTLGAALDRERHIKEVNEAAITPQPGLSQTWGKLDGISYWLSHHYLAAFNLFVFIYVGLPFLAPVLLKAGASEPAAMIYRTYGLVCHQLAFRSFYLFGEQAAYPRSAAGVSDMLTFNQASGLSEGNDADALFTARDFTGNLVMGFKVALCERDLAIYAAILLFGLLYAASGRRLKALPWYIWLVLGIGPIALDGVSQLLSQPPFGLLAYRESTPFLRVLTGSLFGFCTAWFGYPLVEETMAETRQIMSNKLMRVRKSKSLASQA
jgi:uncharacterized membrane protein